MGGATPLSPTPGAQPVQPPLAPGGKLPPLGARTVPFEQKEQELEGKMEKEMSAMDTDSMMKMPTMQTAPPPTPQSTDPKQVWGSAAMALAVIGSALTRQPITNALNAAAGVMKAFQANDTAAAEYQFNAWKVNNDNAIKIANFQIDSYKAILEKHKDNLEALAAEMKGVATAYQDPNMAQAAEMKNMAAMEHLMIDQERFQNWMMMNTGKIQTGFDIRKGLSDLHNTGDYKNAKPMQQIAMDGQVIANADPATAQAEGLISDADIKGMAEQALTGDPTAAMNLGRGKAASINFARFQHEKEQQMRDHHITPQMLAMRNAQFFGIKSGERALGVREANVGTAVAEMQRLAPLALAASKSVDRSTFYPIAVAQNLDKRWTNDSAMHRFNAANLSFVAAYAQVMTRAGVPTEGAREHAEALLNTAFDQEAYAAVIDQLQMEAAAAQHSPFDVQKEFMEMGVTGGEDFNPEGAGGAQAPAGGGMPGDIQGILNKYPKKN